MLYLTPYRAQLLVNILVMHYCLFEEKDKNILFTLISELECIIPKVYMQPSLNDNLEYAR